MVISLGGLLLSNGINYSGSTQGLDCSASCNVRGKRVEDEMVGDGRCNGVVFVWVVCRCGAGRGRCCGAGLRDMNGRNCLFERRSLVLLLSGWVSILLGWRYLMIW